MSILDKQFTPPPRRSHRRSTIIVSIIVIVILVIVIFTDVRNDVAFVIHFVSAPNHFTYHGHTDYVSAVAWSRDSKRIASASGDHTVQVWDAADGSHVLTYRGHSSDVLTLAWSPDGKYIASGSLDTTVQVWNATNGEQVFTYHGHSDAVFNVAWSPDGTRIASVGNDGSVQLWNSNTGGHVVSYKNPKSIKGGLSPILETLAGLYTPWPGLPTGHILPAGGIMRRWRYGTWIHLKTSTLLLVIPLMLIR